MMFWAELRWVGARPTRLPACSPPKRPSATAKAANKSWFELGDESNNWAGRDASETTVGRCNDYFRCGQSYESWLILGIRGGGQDDGHVGATRPPQLI